MLETIITAATSLTALVGFLAYRHRRIEQGIYVEAEAHMEQDGALLVHATIYPGEVATRIIEIRAKNARLQSAIFGTASSGMEIVSPPHDCSRESLDVGVEVPPSRVRSSPIVIKFWAKSCEERKRLRISIISSDSLFKVKSRLTAIERRTRD